MVTILFALQQHIVVRGAGGSGKLLHDIYQGWGPSSTWCMGRCAAAVGIVAGAVGTRPRAALPTLGSLGIWRLLC